MVKTLEQAILEWSFDPEGPVPQELQEALDAIDVDDDPIERAIESGDLTVLDDTGNGDGQTEQAEEQAENPPYTYPVNTPNPRANKTGPKRRAQQGRNGLLQR